MLGGVPFGESDLTECPNQWHSVGAVLGKGDGSRDRGVVVERVHYVQRLALQNVVQRLGLVEHVVDPRQPPRAWLVG